MPGVFNTSESWGWTRCLFPSSTTLTFCSPSAIVSLGSQEWEGLNGLLLLETFEQDLHFPWSILKIYCYNGPILRSFQSKRTSISQERIWSGSELQVAQSTALWAKKRRRRQRVCRAGCALRLGLCSNRINAAHLKLPDPWRNDPADHLSHIPMFCPPSTMKLSLGWTDVFAAKATPVADISVE